MGPYPTFAMTTDLSADAIEQILTGRFGRPATYLPQTDSTNERALKLLMDGAEEGTLVVAGHQTSGRGRRGRRWESPEGTGLLFSLILKPLSPEVLEILTTTVGIAVATAVREISRVEAQLKWPNDVVVAGRKLAGVLVESRLSSGGIEGSVAGVGLNVTWPVDEPEAEALNATSLALLLGDTGEVPSRLDLLKEIIRELEKTYALLHDESGRAEVVKRATELSSVLGHEVVVRFADGSILEGRATGLSPTGELQLEIDGRAETVRVGEIEQLRAT